MKLGDEVKDLINNSSFKNKVLAYGRGVAGKAHILAHAERLIWWILKEQAAQHADMVRKMDLVPDHIIDMNTLLSDEGKRLYAANAKKWREIRDETANRIEQNYEQTKH